VATLRDQCRHYSRPARRRHRCATLGGSEACRARQAAWRAVFDAPQTRSPFLVWGLPDGSCSMSDQTSSRATANPQTSGQPAPDESSSAGSSSAGSSSSRSSSVETSSAVSGSAVAELQQLLLATDDICEFLTQLAVLTVKLLPGELSCGITLRRNHGAFTVASSDTRASQVDEIQYGQKDGPCLHTLGSGEAVVVDDLAQDYRWDGYRLPALGHGVRSSLSLPLRADGEVIGALNIYASTPRAFGPAEQLAAGRFADEASRALALAVRMAERSEMSAHLQNALASRAVIDQALGIVMGQNRCTADEAFEVLRSISQNRNVKLRAVAADMVTAVSGQPPSDIPRFS
jgi:hypothetical protein